METFELICNFVMLVGGAALTIKSISEWIGKPIRLFKKRNDNILEEKIKCTVREMMPQILYDHDLKTKETYKADRERYLHEIEEEVLGDIQTELTAVERLSAQYEKMSEHVAILTLSAKDVLREKIMQIYFKGAETHTITHHDREALVQYYKDYKAMKGNSYIDTYYGRMMGHDGIPGWKVIEDNYDDSCVL